MAEPPIAEILAELSRREPIFHRPEFGTARADFENMMVDDYWEIGASGRRYERAAILDELERRYAVAHEDIWETSDFECRRLAPDVYLLTYKLVQNRERQTRRSTIWQYTPLGWKIVYHQGTIIESRAASKAPETGSETELVTKNDSRKGMSIRNLPWTRKYTVESMRLELQFS